MAKKDNDKEAISQQVTYLGRLFARSMDRQLAELNVAHGQIPSLAALWQEDGISQSELCQRVNIEQPTMANTLNRMERDGLISRKPDPKDRRRALIHLTERGRSLEHDLSGTVKRVNDAASDGLGKKELKEARRLLSRMIVNLEHDIRG